MRKGFEIGELVVRLFDTPEVQEHTGVGIITRIRHERVDCEHTTYEIRFFLPKEHKRYLRGKFLKRLI
jgi:hypothetical protein